MARDDHHRSDRPRGSRRRSQVGGHGYRGGELTSVPLESLIDALVAPTVSEFADPTWRPESPATGPRRALNLLFLVRTLIVLGLVVPAAVAWRGYQVYRHAGELVQQAEIFAAQENWEAAGFTYFQYLQFFPDEVEIWIKMAQMLDRRATTARRRAETLGIYLEALARAEDRVSLRRRVAELLLENDRYSLAQEQAEKLLAADRRDPVGNRVRALAMFGLATDGGRPGWEDVAQALDEARAVLPGDVELAGTLAGVYRRRLAASTPDATTLADATMRDLIEAAPDDPAAQRAFVDYARRHLPDELDAALASALERSPDQPELLYEAGRRAESQGEFDRAGEYFSRLIERHPDDRRGYLGLGQVCLAQRDDLGALDAWQRGLTAIAPDDLVLNLRVADVAVDLGQLDTAARALEAIERSRAKLVPRPLPENLGPAVDFVAAKLAAARGQWYQAVAGFEGLASRETEREVVQETGALLPIYQQLARAYQALGLFDLAAESHEQALRLVPASREYALAAASAWEQAGNLSAARDAYARVLAGDEPPPVAALGHLRTEIELARDQLPDQRSASAVEAALKRAQELAAGEVELARLQAEWQRLAGDAPGALARLVELSRQAHDDPRVAGSLLAAYEELGKRDAADHYLAEWTKRWPERWETHDLWLATHRARGAWPEVVAYLRERMAGATGLEEAGWRNELVAALVAAGQPSEARALLAEPGDAAGAVPLWVWRHRLAVAADDAADAAECERRLAAIEGPRGTVVRWAEARRHLAEAALVTDPAFVAAERLSGELGRLRPGWAETAALAGQVAERQGNFDEALARYRDALDRRASDPEILLAACQLLLRGERAAELELRLARFRERTGLPEATRAELIVMLVAAGRPAEALAWVGLGDGNATRDPRVLWAAGQALAAGGRLAEAEAALRRSRELDPAAGLTWLALADFLSATRQGEALDHLRDEAQAAPALSPGMKALVAGRIEALAGRWTQALELYRRAHEAGTDESPIQRAVAQFAARRDAALAVAAGARVVALDPRDQAAARILIRAQVRWGEQAGWEAAWQAAGGRRERPGLLDERATRARIALVLERGSRDDRWQALALVEQLLANPLLATDEDRLLAAELHQEFGQTRRAGELLRDLVTASPRDPRTIVAYLRHLAGEGDAAEAEPWLAALEATGGDPLAALAVKARLGGAEATALPAEAAWTEALDQLLARAHGPAAQAEVWNQAGRWREELGQTAQAGECLAQAAQLDPAAADPWVRWLVTQGRGTEAVAWRQSQVEASTRVDEVLRLAEAVLDVGTPAEALRTAEAQLAAGREQFPTNLSLHLRVAQVYHQAGQLDAARQAYRAALALDPDNEFALAGEALALAEAGADPKQVLQPLSRALKLGGPTAHLLDLEGRIYFALGQNAEAIRYLSEAIEHPAASPTSLFRLALAYLRAGDRSSAADLLSQARQRGLATAVFTPQERRSLAELEAALARDPAQP